MICKIYQSSMEDWKESIPFDMNANISYVYDCYFPESDGMPIEVLSLWMRQSQPFPLYFCVQVEESFVEMFEETSVQHKIKQCTSKQFKNGYLVAIIEVINSEQFCGIFPLFKVLSCMDDIVLWSTQKDCFSVGDELKNKLLFTFVPIDINLQEGHTVYYLPNAGTSLTIFSNDLKFSTFKNVSSLLPSSVVPILDNED
ncbi:hypothetical protein [Viridibacillus arvi]|uniref:hypothetical protein n=1 Tax=Viridibacillus arvi TaxID=263475 RepID=UPI0036EB1F11